jgi:hypothetical protein
MSKCDKLTKLGFSNKLWAAGGAIALPTALHGYGKMMGGPKGHKELVEYLKTRGEDTSSLAYKPLHVVDKAYQGNRRSTLLGAAGTGALMGASTGHTNKLLLQSEKQIPIEQLKKNAPTITAKYSKPLIPLYAAGMLAGVGLGLKSEKEKKGKLKDLALLSGATGASTGALSAMLLKGTKAFTGRPKTKAYILAANAALGAASPAFGYGWTKLEKVLDNGKEKNTNTA